MNKHLALVREFHQLLAIPQNFQERLPDLEIIEHQVLLLEAGAELGKALKSSELTEMLDALADLAYAALAPLDKMAQDVVETGTAWRTGNSILSVMQRVMEAISRCGSGEASTYSEVYGLCRYLATGFINCDFDNAFIKRHLAVMARAGSGESFYSDSMAAHQIKIRAMPDLTGCLYE